MGQARQLQLSCKALRAAGRRWVATYCAWDLWHDTWPIVVALQRLRSSVTLVMIANKCPWGALTLCLYAYSKHLRSIARDSFELLDVSMRTGTRGDWASSIWSGLMSRPVAWPRNCTGKFISSLCEASGLCLSWAMGCVSSATALGVWSW